MNRISRTIAGLAVASVAVTGLTATTASASVPTHSISASAVHTTKHLSTAKRNAVKSAKSYLKYLSFSRKGLIGQLRYDGYSKKDATYGADHAKAKWKKECAQSAKSYLTYMSFSRSGLAAQLKYDGYTKSQIAYALKAVGY